MNKLWEKSGVCKGDTVLLHSNIRRTLKAYKAKPIDILESFIEAVGENGTLLLPLFNFDFCSGVEFDIRHTPSHMGALTEASRTYPGARRTGHPVYSFAVIGKHASKFEGLCNISAYGNNSPFAKLHELDGKIAVLDLPDQNSMTFYHYVEEKMQVPYRFYKTFSGKYTDESGYTSLRDFKIYVRDVDKGVETYVENMENILWQEGLYQGDKVKEASGLRVIRANHLFNRTKDIIKSGRAENILYRINSNDDCR